MGDKFKNIRQTQAKPHILAPQDSRKLVLPLAGTVGSPDDSTWEAEERGAGGDRNSGPA